MMRALKIQNQLLITLFISCKPLFNGDLPAACFFLFFFWNE